MHNVETDQLLGRLRKLSDVYIEESQRAIKEYFVQVGTSIAYKIAYQSVEVSDREREVLGHILAGKTNKEIGNILNIGTRTVKFHASNIYVKYHVRNRFQLQIKLSRKIV